MLHLNSVHPSSFPPQNLFLLLSLPEERFHVLSCPTRGGRSQAAAVQRADYHGSPITTNGLVFLHLRVCALWCRPCLSDVCKWSICSFMVYKAANHAYERVCESRSHCGVAVMGSLSTCTFCTNLFSSLLCCSCKGDSAGHAVEKVYLEADTDVSNMKCHTIKLFWGHPVCNH